jgi:hypothetical protein
MLEHIFVVAGFGRVAGNLRGGVSRGVVGGSGVAQAGRATHSLEDGLHAGPSPATQQHVDEGVQREVE